MSDASDRSGLFDGGTGPKQPFCEDPTPHSNCAGVDDRETASVSPSEDYSDLFDYGAYYASGRTTDVTTQSDVPSSAGKPAVMPSAATPAGAPAAGPDQDEDCPMSDPPEGPNQDEDCPMQDAPPPEPQPPHVWPKVLGPHPPRDTNILVEASPSPPASADMHQKKTRVVKDREETGKVRELGSCYPCKMNKKACNSEAICDACKNKPLSKLTCIRTPLSEMIPARFVRWNWNNPSREQSDRSSACRLLISCSDDVNSPCLQLEAYTFGPPGQGRLDIVLSERPSKTQSWEDVICHWMEQQILVESRIDFEAEMDRLLVEFVRQARTNMRPTGQQMVGGLLSNLFQMRCMWKVWGCKQLFFRHQRGSQGVPFDLQFEAIQDSLRRFAGQKISELERKILPEIDKYVVAGKDRSRTGATEMDVVMKWFSSWQLMLTYRQSWSWVLEQQQTNAKTLVAPMDVTRHEFRDTTRRLFEGIIVIYSGVFLKKTTIEKIRGVDRQVFGANQSLYAAYQKVWQTLPYPIDGRVARQMSPTDELFFERIVKKESNHLLKACSGFK